MTDCSGCGAKSGSARSGLAGKGIAIVLAISSTADIPPTGVGLSDMPQYGQKMSDSPTLELHS
jgi:hypothetical protein